tara:strand:+ start:180 stop:473 length:294 start_codon:yes stop_codon:yes gene_type:complete
VETPRIPFGFSLASRLGNALALIFQRSGLKNKKSAQASLADFFVLIPDCARSLQSGAEGSEVELFWGGFDFCCTILPVIYILFFEQSFLGIAKLLIA